MHALGDASKSYDYRGSPSGSNPAFWQTNFVQDRNEQIQKSCCESLLFLKDLFVAIDM